MSDFYTEGNDETALELFQKRYIYRSHIVGSSKLKNIVNFNRGEKYFYGRVNRVFVPMQYNAAGPPLKGLNGTRASTTGAPLQALGFVVDAFNALSMQFRKCTLSGQISSTDPHLSNLIVYKAYADPQAEYNKYLDSTMTLLRTQFVRRKTVLYNFDDFIKELMMILDGFAAKFPFTMPAYVKSKYCPITSSGLALEIAEEMSAADDNAKIEQFMKSRNWPFFVNACNTYGFMIDEFVPWRLVADIGSAPMLQFAKQYRGLNSTDSIINRAYKKVHLGYYKKFKYYLLNLYNRVKAPAYMVTEECNEKTIVKMVIPEEYTIQQLNEKYGDAYFLRLYCQMRFYEEPSFFDEAAQYRLMDDASEVQEARGTARALRDFERIINKPFDYRGSLSYISRHQAAVRDSEDP